MRTTALLLLLSCCSFALAERPDWSTYHVERAKLESLETQKRQVQAELDVLRDGLSPAEHPELAKALQRVEQTGKLVDVAHDSQGELVQLRDKLKAAQAKRDGEAMEILRSWPRGRQAADRYETMDQRIAQLEARISKLSAEEVSELARLRDEHKALGRRLYGIRRALWERAEVQPLYKQADAAYDAYGRARKKNQPLADAEKEHKEARKQLDKVRREIELTGPVAGTLKARKADLQLQIDELSKQVDSLRKILMDGSSVTTLTVEMPPRKGKPRAPQRATLWLPPGDEPIRGVIVAHPMIKSMATHPRIREVAAEVGLATIVAPNFSFNGHETIKHFDAMLEKFAEKTGRSELKGAALLPAGLSASVLAARNVGYAAPDRTLGIVHVAGGNMHHNIVDPAESLTGVPFIAFNGEFEWCGPEGGIRPEYGRQTQWVMIREQLLRRWKSDHQHLMSLVVVPGKDHGAWDVDLAALFVRKAVKYRAPEGRRDGSKPAQCRTIRAEDGWLTDADITDPANPPAAFADYKGDKDFVFWHFDEQMARAVRAYHKDRFLLPDPTETTPIPATWPKQPWKK